LSSTIATLYQTAGKQRFAARLYALRASICLRQRNFGGALEILIPLVSFYKQHGWYSLYEWAVLRVAFCFRELNDPTNYFDALSQLFSKAGNAHNSNISKVNKDLVLVTEKLKHSIMGEMRSGERAKRASFEEDEKYLRATLTKLTPINTRSPLLH